MAVYIIHSVDVFFRSFVIIIFIIDCYYYKLKEWSLKRVEYDRCSHGYNHAIQELHYNNGWVEYDRSYHYLLATQIQNGEDWKEGERKENVNLKKDERNDYFDYKE